MAVDALGADNVRCVMLPSRVHLGSIRWRMRTAVARALGLPVGHRADQGPARRGGRGFGGPCSQGTQPGITEENIQSRLRGLMLMALSNKFGEMLLTTGNKSEMAVGYCTIYGDMNGGYNPVKDLYTRPACS